jgi:glutathione peroxidase|tara:strand:- start:2729 stop:3274 length:546 start_codon:yes stop_codon:yes gene_type:complete
MKKFFFLFVFMINFFSNANAQYDQLATNFKFNGIDSSIVDMSYYKNKVIVVVNVASRCGFTNQYEDLQKLWTTYKKQGLVVIGVPSDNFRQEPGSNKEIKDFCETTFGIDFPITEKMKVIGKDAHPFFLWAKKNHGMSAVPKWNFHKIIIGKNGKVANTFSSITNPSSNKFVKTIQQELKN